MADQPEQALWRCNLCGFTVPIDEIGRALMHEHLRDHKRENRDG